MLSHIFGKKQQNQYLRNLRLNSVVFEACSILEGMANKKNIGLYNSVSESQVVFADKSMIDTILRNLISNAIKFTNKGGEITISSKQQINNNLLEISILDTGIGISSERAKTIFNIDNKYSTQDTENEIGTGLGLILCQEFVKKHGGKIWAESEINKGSVFKFTIPTIH